METTWWTYDFGYTWYYTSGHLLVLVVFAALATLSYWRQWPSLATGLLAFGAVWGLAGAVIVHQVLQLNEPQRLPAEFLAEGKGRVLDLGAGSGRGTVGLLLARPEATAFALDLYRGYYGIDDNTPERLHQNARTAGVDARVQVRVGDMRELPFGEGEFDAVMSVAALDHLPWAGIDQTLREAHRVLRPGGQLLSVSLNVDHLVLIALPAAIHGHGYWGTSQNRQRWRDALTRAGFTDLAVRTAPATLYFLARRA